jgi:hypothetical protein
MQKFIIRRLGREYFGVFAAQQSKKGHSIPTSLVTLFPSTNEGREDALRMARSLTKATKLQTV